MYPELNSSTMAELAVYVNTVTDGFFWTIMLFVMFIIMAALFSGLRSERSLLISAFLTMIIAILLRTLDLVPNEIIFVTIISTFVLLIISYVGDS